MRSAIASISSDLFMDTSTISSGPARVGRSADITSFGTENPVSPRDFGRGDALGSTTVVAEAARLASRRRSASSRSRSTSPVSRYVNAPAIACDLRRSSIRRCIVCATRRYVGWPWGCDRSSVRCIASRALICITNRMRYAIDTAYCAASSSPAALQLALHLGAGLHDAVPLGAAAPASSMSSGTSGPCAGGEALPFDGERSMALEVAERAVVAQDVEPVLPCAPTRGPACGAGSARRPREAAGAPRVARASSRAPRRGADRRADPTAAYITAAATFSLAVGVPVGERRPPAACLGGARPAATSR